MAVVFDLSGILQDVGIQTSCCRAARRRATIELLSLSNDVFLLFFGFVPTDNPNDSVVLFGDLEEVVDFVVEEIHVEEGYANLDYCEVTSLLLGELEESLGGPEADFTR